MKNETKPNWLVPKIHGRARKQEEGPSQKAARLDGIPSGSGGIPEQVSNMYLGYLHVLLSRNSDYPKSCNRVSVQLRTVSCLLFEN